MPSPEGLVLWSKHDSELTPLYSLRGLNPYCEVSRSRWRRRGGARQILEGRENGSRNGAEAEVESTSTSMQTMSMSTEMCKRQWAAEQAVQCSMATGAMAATMHAAAATRNKLKTSEAAARVSYGAPATTGVGCVRGWQAIYCLCTMVSAAKPCEQVAAAAAMTQHGTDGRIELLDSWWRLFNSITPLMSVDCSTYT